MVFQEKLDLILQLASEIMAILCLADDLMDMKKRFSKIVIGYNYDRQPVTAADIGAQGAMTVLMKDAIKPNLVSNIRKYTSIRTRWTIC